MLIFLSSQVRILQQLPRARDNRSTSSHQSRAHQQLAQVALSFVAVIQPSLALAISGNQKESLFGAINFTKTVNLNWEVSWLGADREAGCVCRWLARDCCGPTSCDRTQVRPRQRSPLHEHEGRRRACRCCERLNLCPCADIATLEGRLDIVDLLLRCAPCRPRMLLCGAYRVCAPSSSSRCWLAGAAQKHGRVRGARGAADAVPGPRQDAERPDRRVQAGATHYIIRDSYRRFVHPWCRCATPECICDCYGFLLKLFCAFAMWLLIECNWWLNEVASS